MIAESDNWDDLLKEQKYLDMIDGRKNGKEETRQEKAKEKGVDLTK